MDENSGVHVPPATLAEQFTLQKQIRTIRDEEDVAKLQDLCIYALEQLSAQQRWARKLMAEHLGLTPEKLLGSHTHPCDKMD